MCMLVYFNIFKKLGGILQLCVKNTPHHLQGLKPYSIAKTLKTEGIQVSQFGVHVHKFIIMYTETGSIDRRPGSGRISKVASHVKMLVEEQINAMR